MNERIVQLGEGRNMIGVLTEPAAAQRSSALPGMIFVNTGLVHRVGAQRMSVNLARLLASRGYPALRVDFSGIGDSKALRRPLEGGRDVEHPLRSDQHGNGRRSGRPSYFGRWVAEAREAIDFLVNAAPARGVVLLGHCSGATVSFFTGLADPRVLGLVLLNAPGPFQPRETLRNAILHPSSWRRLIAGKLKVRSFIQRLTGRGRLQPRGQTRILADLRSLGQREVDVLLVQSEWDSAYAFFSRLFRERLDQPGDRERLKLETLPGADHELTLGGHQDRYLQIVDEWAARLRQERWR